jgi:beta-ribofuranosylaminobenzene 5'-phosphate synthase
MPLADATQTEFPSQRPRAPKSARSPAGAVRVIAPARLHLGFLDLNGSLGRRFGSIGLAIDEPRTELVLRRAPTFKAEGPDRERALKALQRYAEAFSCHGAFELDIQSAIPRHSGLGSGTQLALAVGAALMALEGRDHTPGELGELVDRGARSAIGMGAFESGGFIVDGGRGQRDHAPPILMRADFPESWRTLLIMDTNTTGVHGDAEAQAFARLPCLPEAASAHVCRLVLMQLAPALMECDIATFGAALSEIQSIVGGHFAAAQGGAPWTSPAVGRIASKLKEAGAFGIGQSSWGPTGFAFAPSQENAQHLYATLVGAARAEGLEIRIARGRNRGATIEPIASN